ncbi:MAG: hypothetical protein R6W89_04700 [Candidatus Hydrogenedentota bacterium]
MERIERDIEALKDENEALRRRVELLELQMKAVNMWERLFYLKRCNPDRAGWVEEDLKALRRQIAELSDD